MYDESADAGRASATIRSTSEETSTTLSNDEAREMAKRWYTLADEDEKLRISGVTTHKWIQDESASSTHQLLAPRDSDLDAILRKDAVIENRERRLKVTWWRGRKKKRKKETYARIQKTRAELSSSRRGNVEIVCRDVVRQRFSCLTRSRTLCNLRCEEIYEISLPPRLPADAL